MRYRCCCGLEFVRLDSPHTAPCPVCGRQARPPEHPPSPARDQVADAVASLLAFCPADLLRRWAAQGLGLPPAWAHLHRERARRLLGPAGMAYLAALGEEEAEALLDALWQRVPRQAQVLWEHPAWYRRRLREIALYLN